MNTISIVYFNQRVIKLAMIKKLLIFFRQINLQRYMAKWITTLKTTIKTFVIKRMTPELSLSKFRSDI